MAEKIQPLLRLDPADGAVMATIDHIMCAGPAVDEEQRVGVAQVEHHHRVGHAGRRDVDPRFGDDCRRIARLRSEEHTSELQSLMRISYAVLCLKNKTQTHTTDAAPQ